MKSKEQAMAKCPMCGHLLAQHSVMGCTVPNCNCGQCGEAKANTTNPIINYEELVDFE